MSADLRSLEEGEQYQVVAAVTAILEDNEINFIGMLDQGILARFKNNLILKEIIRERLNVPGIFVIKVDKVWPKLEDVETENWIVEASVVNVIYPVKTTDDGVKTEESRVILTSGKEIRFEQDEQVTIDQVGSFINRIIDKVQKEDQMDKALPDMNLALAELELSNGRLKESLNQTRIAIQHGNNSKKDLILERVDFYESLLQKQSDFIRSIQTLLLDKNYTEYGQTIKKINSISSFIRQDCSEIMDGHVVNKDDLQ